MAGSEPLLVAIIGPTASGKTALALALAEEFGGEIVNCDSVAAYREFEIGTAKPTPEARSRVPHHLLDIVGPTEELTAGEYARRARAALQQIAARGKLPIVVGGTGLYLRALLDGLFAGPPRSEELRERLRGIAGAKGTDYLHRVLRRMDPSAAGKIHANDQPKLIRAIEVCLAARRPITEMWSEGREPLHGFRILRIGLDPAREALYARINQRAAQMFETGLVDETQGLLEKYGEAAKQIDSLGYKQAAQFLRGEVSRERAIADAQQGHRNYAKRQMTWFRREPAVHWFAAFGDDPETCNKAISIVRMSLKTMG
jgi:tRNA dimethylallyltransferase